MVILLKKLKIITLLIWRFLSSVMLSAWVTSKIILTDSSTPNQGIVEFKYGKLSERGVALFSMFVLLTPGSSVLEIHPEQCTLVLHLLDTTDLESTIQTLETDFLVPIRYLFGEPS